MYKRLLCTILVLMSLLMYKQFNMGHTLLNCDQYSARKMFPFKCYILLFDIYTFYINNVGFIITYVFVGSNINISIMDSYIFLGCCCCCLVIKNFHVLYKNITPAVNKREKIM